MAALSVRERAVMNAELDTAIRRRAQSINIGARLAAEGVTTVSLDDGVLTEHQPDGSSVALGGQT